MRRSCRPEIGLRVLGETSVQGLRVGHHHRLDVGIPDDCEKRRLVVLMLIILIVYPAGVVDPPVIDHVEIPAAREGHVAFGREVKDRILRS